MDNNNPLTLGLCVVAIGCDVLSDGIPGVTPLSISKELKRIKEKEKVSDNDHGLRYKYLMKYFLSKNKTNKLSELDLHTFCQAFLYQPALEFGKRNESDAYKYIFHKPSHTELIN